MEPAHAASEDSLPIEIARFQEPGGFVRAVIEHHRGAHAVAAVAIHRRHIWAAHAIVLEVLIERTDAHGLHALGDQVAHRIVHHGGGDARLHAEAVREVGGAIELAAGNVDQALGGLAERDDSGIQAMDECAQGHEIQGAVGTNLQTMTHV